MSTPQTQVDLTVDAAPLESTADNIVSLTLRIEAQLSGPGAEVAANAPNLAGALVAMLYPHEECE